MLQLRKVVGPFVRLESARRDVRSAYLCNLYAFASARQRPLPGSRAPVAGAGPQMIRLFLILGLIVVAFIAVPEIMEATKRPCHATNLNNIPAWSQNSHLFACNYGGMQFVIHSYFEPR